MEVAEIALGSAPEGLARVESKDMPAYGSAGRAFARVEAIPAIYPHTGYFYRTWSRDKRRVLFIILHLLPR